MASPISAQLHTILPKPCFDRPFVCDGLPEECVVMVIGENPALKLGVDWWTFWDDDSGFDIRKFEILFKEKSIASGIRLRARRTIDRLLCPLRNAGLRCLVTNKYRNENLGGYRGGTHRVSNVDVLRTLFKEIPRLKAVVAHGNEAKDFMSSQPLPPHVRYFQRNAFRSVNYENIDAIAREILES